MEIHKIQEALVHMHRDVSARRLALLEAVIKGHNRKTRFRSPNFSIGDYVLVAKRLAKDGHKPQLQWKGLQGITRTESA